MIGLKRNNQKLTKWLVRDGHLSRQQGRLAVKLAAESGRSLCQELVHNDLIGEEELFTYLAERLGLPTVDRSSLSVDVQTLESVPVELRYRRDILPLKKVGGSLSIAIADPTDRATLDALAEETGLHIRPVLAALPALNNAHERLEGLDNLRKIAEDSELFKCYVSFFETLTEYRFEKVVGQGGFGVVCLCWQASQERHVAIKVLNPEWNAVTQVAERFRREGGIISQLDHPSIIEVFEQGELDGIGYIVMEYFEGRRLDEHLAERDWGRVLSALLQVCHALDYAHQKGVIHRDIKPANVLGNELGAVKLLDFGVAHYDAQPSGLTTPQVILGTPKYMAPELHWGADKTSNASDLYAFGVMAYEVLTKKSCEQGQISHPAMARDGDPALPAP